MSKAPCSGCGQLLFVTKKSRPSPTCRACRGRGRASCLRCGVEFDAPQSKARRFCSRECYHAHRTRPGEKGLKPLKTATCQGCGTEFTHRQNEQKYCSRSCGVSRGRPPRIRRPSDIRTLIWVRDCKRCDRAFVTRHPNKAFCSVPCREGDNSTRIVTLYALAVEHGASSGRWRKALCDLLVERDGKACGICGEDVNVNIPSGPKGKDEGPSVDHITPRSMGGKDELSNLRLTHWGCNRNRGNRETPHDQVGRQTTPQVA